MNLKNGNTRFLLISVSTLLILMAVVVGVKMIGDKWARGAFQKTAPAMRDEFVQTVNQLLVIVDEVAKHKQTSEVTNANPIPQGRLKEKR